MANSFDISDKPEIAANLVQILSNASALGTIQITTLPDIATQNTNIKTAVDSIINNHIPGTNAKVELNLAAIDTIDGIVDAIKLKTDATPQNVRGQLKVAHLATASPSFVDVLNVTGHGKLFMLGAYPETEGQNCELSLIIDGTTYTTFTNTTAANKFIFQSINTVTASALQLNSINYSLGTEELTFNLEYDASLQIQIRNTTPAPASINCKVIYSLDRF